MPADTPPLIRARIRRWYVPNAVYFITSVLQGRQPLFADAFPLALLRDTIRHTKIHHPFTMVAYAFLPDHFHFLILVPETTNISKLMQSIHRNFTLDYKKILGIATPLHLWQRGFWDHVTRDEHDLERHFDYIHYNPAKHGLVSKPSDYPHSSFLEYVKRGWYGAAMAEDVTGARRGFER